MINVPINVYKNCITSSVIHNKLNNLGGWIKRNSYLVTPWGWTGLNVLSSLSSFLTVIFGCSSGFLACLLRTWVLVFSAGVSPPGSSVWRQRPRIFKTSPAFRTVSNTSFDTVVSPTNNFQVGELFILFMFLIFFILEVS